MTGDISIPHGGDRLCLDDSWASCVLGPLIGDWWCLEESMRLHMVSCSLLVVSSSLLEVRSGILRPLEVIGGVLSSPGIER